MNRDDIAAGIRPELLVSAVLVVLNGAVVLLGPPVWITAPISLMVLAVVSERVARYRRRSPLDHLLTAVAGCFVALILLGVVLNFAPWGITSGSWAVGVTTLGLAALGACVGRPSPPSLLHELRNAPRPGGFNVGAGVAGVLVVIGVVVASVVAANGAQVDAVVLSVAEPSGGFAEVTIDGGAGGGDFGLVRVIGDEGVVVAEGVLAPPHGEATLSIPLPDGERSELRLYRTGENEPMRTIIVDRTVLRE